MAMELRCSDRVELIEHDDEWLFPMAQTIVPKAPGLDGLWDRFYASPTLEPSEVAQVLEELRALQGGMVAALLEQRQIRIRKPELLAAIVQRLSAKQPRLTSLARLIGFFTYAAETGLPMTTSSD